MAVRKILGAAALLTALVAGTAMPSQADVSAEEASSSARVTATIVGKMSDNSITQGEVTYVEGTVTPPRATARVVVQRRVAGRWGDRQPGNVSSDGKFRIGIRPSESGIYALRLRSNGGSVVSNVIYLRINPVPGGTTPTRPAVPGTPTPPPTTRPTPPPTTAPASRCHPNYTPCVPIASDVDCASGSGNGPVYIDFPVRVIGADKYGLDGNDNDGLGCEDE